MVPIPTKPFPLTTNEGVEVPKSETAKTFSSVPNCSMPKVANGVVEPIPILPGPPLLVVVSIESIAGKVSVVVVEIAKAFTKLFGIVEVALD